MKRLWIGIGVLLALLILGGITAAALGSLHSELSGILEDAAALALNGQQPQAADKVSQAATLWQRYHHIAAAFADHEPLEEMDSLFSRLQVYCRIGDEKDLADACLQLSSLSRDVAESHGLAWWSLL